MAKLSEVEERTALLLQLLHSNKFPFVIGVVDLYPEGSHIRVIGVKFLSRNFTIVHSKLRVLSQKTQLELFR